MDATCTHAHTSIMHTLFYFYIQISLLLQVMHYQKKEERTKFSFKIKKIGNKMFESKKKLKL